MEEEVSLCEEPYYLLGLVSYFPLKSNLRILHYGLLPTNENLLSKEE